MTPLTEALRRMLAEKTAHDELETGHYSADYQLGVADECERRVQLDEALIAAVEALEKVAREGSEQYENTPEQVPRDHLAALLLMARYEAQKALTKLRKLAAHGGGEKDE